MLSDYILLPQIWFQWYVFWAFWNILLCIVGRVNGGRVCCCGLCCYWQVTGYIWHVIGDRWQATGDRWQVSCQALILPLYIGAVDCHTKWSKTPYDYIWGTYFVPRCMPWLHWPIYELPVEGEIVDKGGKKWPWVFGRLGWLGIKLVDHVKSVVTEY